MKYALIIVGGLIGGLSIPLHPKTVLAGAVLAVCYVAAIAFYAAALGYDATTTLSFLLLREDVPVHRPGLSALIVGAGVWVLSVLIATVRLFVSGKGASNGASHDGAA